MKRYNLAVRQTALLYGVPMYVVAQLMEISESMLTKKMRTEWSEEEQKRVVQLIKSYAGAEDDRTA